MKRGAPLQRKTPLKASSERRKRCPVCRIMYHPARKDQKVCGEVACALSYVSAEEGKAEVKKAMNASERESHKAAKAKVKTKGEHMREAQAVFNKWIRLRDAGQPCISCGTTADVQYAAGHFRTTAAAPALRFEPLNVHLQCNRYCNMALSGNLLAYKPNLIKKIGEEAVAWLEGPHEPKRYTIPDLIEIKAKYRKLIREIEKST